LSETRINKQEKLQHDRCIGGESKRARFCHKTNLFELISINRRIDSECFNNSTIIPSDWKRPPGRSSVRVKRSWLKSV